MKNRIAFVLGCIVILLTFVSCMKTTPKTGESSKTGLDSLDFKADLIRLYPDVEWGMVMYSSTKTNGKLVSYEFNIECPRHFLTDNPKAEEIIRNDLLSKYPELKDIKLNFKFEPTDLP